MTSEEAEKIAQGIDEIIQKNEGVIIKQTAPIARTLSQVIKGHASGFFGTLEFQLEQEKLTEVKTFVEKDKKVVRHMLLVKKPVKIKKQRRSRKEVVGTTVEIKTEGMKPEVKTEETPKAETPKVELKDIEDKLEEILG